MHSSPTKPSPAVYRRRRLVAGVVLVVVALLLWWLGSIVVGAVSGSDDGAEGGTATETSVEAVPAPTGEPPVEPETPSDPPTPSAPATPPVCSATEVTVTANVDAEAYAADSRPKLSMTLRNNSDQPCVMDVGTAAQEYLIKSGEDVIWVSTHCQTDAKPQVVQLDPGKEVTSPQLEWVRERSAPDTCDSQRPAAVGGGAYYSLTVTVAGIASEPVYFVLN